MLPTSHIATISKPVNVTRDPMESASKTMVLTCQPMEIATNAMEVSRQPIQIAHNPMETNSEPVKTSSMPMESTRKPLETARKPVETACKPMKTARKQMKPTRGAMQTSFNPLETTRKLIVIARKPKEAAHKPTETARNTTETAHNTMVIGSKPLEAARNPMASGSPAYKCYYDPCAKRFSTLSGLITHAKYTHQIPPKLSPKELRQMPKLSPIKTPPVRRHLIVDLDKTPPPPALSPVKDIEIVTVKSKSNKKCKLHIVDPNMRPKQHTGFPRVDRTNEDKWISTLCPNITLDPAQCGKGIPFFLKEDFEAFRQIVAVRENGMYECISCEVPHNENKIKAHMSVYHGVVVPLQVPLEILFDPNVIIM